MAVARMAAADNHTVSTFLKSTENEHGIYTAGTRNTDNFYISRIIEPVVACKVSTRIGAPVAAKRHNIGSKFVFFIYLHIASTSAIICLLENPSKSIAPEGHVTVQAPQPWHTAALTDATRRIAVVLSGILNSFSK